MTKTLMLGLVGGLVFAGCAQDPGASAVDTPRPYTFNVEGPQYAEYPLPEGLGAVLWSGKYTAGSSANYAGDGAHALALKGFHLLKIPLDPSDIAQFGIAGIPGDDVAWLANAASTPSFTDAMSDPRIDTVLLSAFDAIVVGLSGSQRDYTNTDVLTARAADITSSYQSLAYYLAKTFSGTGKQFVIINWETDNALYCGSAYQFDSDPNFRASCLATYPSTYGAADPTAAAAAISQWCTYRYDGIQQGVAQARAEGANNVSVLSGIEFNTIRLVHQLGYPTALYDIIPYTPFDVITYSSYESTNTGALVDDFPLIEAQARGLPIYVSEYGFGYTPDNGSEALMTQATQQINSLQAQGRLHGAAVWQGFQDSADPNFGVLDDAGNNTPLFNALLAGVGVSASPQPIPDVPVTALVNEAVPSQCADVTGFGTAPGTPMEVWQCWGGSPQQLHFRPDTGELRVNSDTACIDAGGGQGNDGDPIVIWTCDDLPQQQWHLSANGSVVGLRNKCIDVAGAPSNGAQLILNTCNGSASQLWHAPSLGL